MPPVTAAYEDEAFGTTEPLFERLKLSDVCCDVSSPGYGHMNKNSTHDMHVSTLLI